MSFALIGRCDAGGLATITQEVYRHLTPARTLVLDVAGARRGDCNRGLYGDDETVLAAPFAGALPASAVEWLCAVGVDTLYSAETCYDDAVLRAARANGIRTIVHAMPELAPWADGAPPSPPSSPKPSELLIPTGWRAHTLLGARWLPIPVARDRLPFRARDRAAHLFHVTGSAMLDRNGTNLLLAALGHVEQRCRLTIRTERPLRIPTGTRVDVTVIDARAGHYWEVYPPDIDLLVMPRRYGGLSLPVQECASLGVPSIVLDQDPYASTPFTTTVGSTRSRPAQMKGGTVPVFDADPRALAAEIDRLVAGARLVHALSGAADVWADAHRWDGPLGDTWCRLLDADCALEDAA